MQQGVQGQDSKQVVGKRKHIDSEENWMKGGG